MPKPEALVARVRQDAPKSQLSATLAPFFYIQVVDEADKPLSGEKYAIHQDNRKHEGVLDASGLAFFFNVDEKRPFRFEVIGRVCAIVEGAVLLKEQLDKDVGKGGIEYGGTFVDWTWADDGSPFNGTTKESLFWKEYAQVMQKSDFLRLGLPQRFREMDRDEARDRQAIQQSERQFQRSEAELERAQKSTEVARHDYNEALVRFKRAERHLENVQQTEQNDPVALPAAKRDYAEAKAERDRAKETYDLATAKEKLAREEYDLANREYDRALTGGVTHAEKRLGKATEYVRLFRETLFLYGPSSFWQHDHITRRDIQIRPSYLSRFNERVVVIKAIPMQLRVGPLVRFTRHDTAVIWLELETPGLVRVAYRKNDDQKRAPTQATRSDQLKEKDFQFSHGSTVRVGGRNFAVVVLRGLEMETLYDYTVEMAPHPAVLSIPVKEGSFPGVFPELSERVLTNLKQQLAQCSFRSESRFLSFRTLRQSYDDKLRFAYGSCRKWPYDEGPTEGSGSDMLEVLGREYLTDAKELGVISYWPSFLLLVGDQIYADDIGVDTAKMIVGQRFGARVPGPQDAEEGADGAWAGRYAHRYLEIQPEKLQEWTSQTIQALESSYAILKQERDRASGDFGGLTVPATGAARTTFGSLVDLEHTLSEFEGQMKAFRELAVLSNFIREEGPRIRRFSHLLTNHLLWKVPVFSKDLPAVRFLTLRAPRSQPEANRRFYPSAGDTAGIHAADFAEYAFLYERAWGLRLSHTRKVLAHLPTFMTFDDHEVTDDWNFSDMWVKLVEDPEDTKRHWPATITDALIAYWVYEGWGNLPPEKWETDPRTSILLRAMASGTDALPDLRRTISPVATRRTKADMDRLPWHFELPIRPVFLFLDTRMRRRVGGDRTIDLEQLQWVEAKLLESRHTAAFVVSQTPYLLPRFASFAMKHPGVQAFLEDKKVEEVLRGHDFEHMVRDKSWNDVRDMLARINDTVTSLKTIVLLSGDVHFSYNMVARLPGDGYECEILQMVCSGIKYDLGPKNKKLLRLFLDWFARDHHVDGLNLKLGGFENLGEKQNALVLNNSIALVEVSLGTPNQVTLRQMYLTADADSGAVTKPIVWYRRDGSGGFPLKPQAWPA